MKKKDKIDWKESLKWEFICPACKTVIHLNSHFCMFKEIICSNPACRKIWLLVDLSRF